MTSSSIDKIRKAGAVFGRFAAAVCTHPRWQWKAARHIWREESFDNWLESFFDEGAKIPDCFWVKLNFKVQVTPLLDSKICFGYDHDL